MTILELEQVIREYILDICNKEYIGKIEIIPINSKGYNIRLGMNNPNAPIVIYGELEDDQFLKFLKGELKTKKFHLVYYGSLNLVLPYNDCQSINTVCSCQKKN